MKGKISKSSVYFDRLAHDVMKELEKEKRRKEKKKKHGLNDGRNGL
jgi:hypothetical protein